MDHVYIITNPQTGVITGVYDSLKTIIESLPVTYSKRPNAKPKIVQDENVWYLRIEDGPGLNWIDACITKHMIITQPQHL